MRRFLRPFTQEDRFARGKTPSHDVDDHRLRPKSEWASFAEIRFRAPDPCVFHAEFLADGGEIATLSNKARRCHVRGCAAAACRGGILTALPPATLSIVFLRHAGSQLQQIFEHTVPKRRTQAKQQN